MSKCKYLVLAHLLFPLSLRESLLVAIANR